MVRREMRLLLPLLVVGYGLVYCRMASMVPINSLFTNSVPTSGLRQPELLYPPASKVVVVVPGHGSARRLPYLKRSLTHLRNGFADVQQFDCLVFVYKMSLMPKTVSELKFCNVVYNEGLWTDHMRRAPGIIGNSSSAYSHTVLMMDDIDATSVRLPAMIQTMERAGYSAATPSLPGWQTSSLLQRKHCLAHRSDHIDILFTVFTKAAWDCWQSMIHTGVANHYGWGFDLTFSEYCGITLGITDHEMARHDPERCESGGDCEMRSYDSEAARNEMDQWIISANVGVETIEEANAYFKHVAFLRPLTFDYCDLIQLYLPSDEFYKSTTHRGGWKTIVEGTIDLGIVSTRSQQRYRQSQYVDVVDCIEEWFLWARRGPIDRAWIGITHLLTSDLLAEHHRDNPVLALDTYLDSPEFATSAPTCVALVFFTKELEQAASKRLQANGFTNIKTCVIQHPIAVVEEFVEEFDAAVDIPAILSDESAVILLGQQYRRVATLHKLQTPRKKIWLPSRTDLAFLNPIIQKELSVENVTADPSVVIDRVDSNEDYDRKIKQNIVVIDFWAAAANNAVMEAIALKAPFFIRRLPGPEEYLGADYPLFFSSVDELEGLISNPNDLKDALTRGHAHLQSMDRKNLSIEHFGNSLNACALSALNSEKDHPGKLPPGVSPPLTTQTSRVKDAQHRGSDWS